MSNRQQIASAVQVADELSATIQSANDALTSAKGFDAKVSHAVSRSYWFVSQSLKSFTSALTACSKTLEQADTQHIVASVAPVSTGSLKSRAAFVKGKVEVQVASGD